MQKCRQTHECMPMAKCMSAWKENEQGKEGCIAEGELRRENRTIEIRRDSSAVGCELGLELHASTKELPEIYNSTLGVCLPSFHRPLGTVPCLFTRFIWSEGQRDATDGSDPGSVFIFLDLPVLVEQLPLPLPLPIFLPHFLPLSHHIALDP